MTSNCPQCNSALQSGQGECPSCGHRQNEKAAASVEGVIKLLAISVAVLVGLLMLDSVLHLIPRNSGPSSAHRIKCVNNLGSISKALLAFSQDNAGRTPWNLEPAQQTNHFGTHYSPSPTAVFGLVAIKKEIQTEKILVSSCDSARIADNVMLQENWATIDTKAGKPINPATGISYVFCEGGNFGLQATVVALTLNFSSEDLAAGYWTGADENPLHKNAMSGLNRSQGNFVLAGGSAKQSSNAVGPAGKYTQPHLDGYRGATPSAPPSTKVLR